MELTIRDHQIDIEEICIMHVNESTLIIKYSMGQEVISFESEEHAVKVMDSLSKLNEVAIENLGLL